MSKSYSAITVCFNLIIFQLWTLQNFQFCSEDSPKYDPEFCQVWKDTTLMKQCRDEHGVIVKCGFIFSETGTWVSIFLFFSWCNSIAHRLYVVLVTNVTLLKHFSKIIVFHQIYQYSLFICIHCPLNPQKIRSNKSNVFISQLVMSEKLLINLNQRLVKTSKVTVFKSGSPRRFSCCLHIIACCIWS